MDITLNGSYQYYIADDFVLPYVRPNKRIDCVVGGVCPENVAEVAHKIEDVYGCVEVFIDGDNCSCDALVTRVQDTCEVLLKKQERIMDRRRFDFTDIEEIMKILRSKDGCEWDKAQTHESIRINLIEEAYELVEAIDCKSAEMMLEETGDVLMQSVFHTQMAEESGEFDWADMMTALARKLLDRHTHIFGENHADNAEQALVFWNEAKKREKRYKSTTDAMDRVPKCLPSLLYAEKVQKLAKKSGFDWPTVDGAADKVREELNEVLSASAEKRFEECGDLLFAVCNVLRFYKIDPEMALREASKKFLRRYDYVERKATENGGKVSDYTLQQLDVFWEQAKSLEKQEG